MNLYEHYLDIREREASLKAEKLQCEEMIYTEHASIFNVKDKGVVHVVVPGFKITVDKKETVKVDQELASGINVGVRKKYELDAKAYGLLSQDDKRRVDEAITITPAKPQFKVEKI